MDRLRAPLDVEVQARLLEFFAHGADELSDVAVARALRLVELLLDVLIAVGVDVFQRQIFQLALDRVEAEAMRQRGVEVGDLGGQADAVVVVADLFTHAHHAEAVGNHDEDHAHIFGKGEEQVVEVLRVDRRVAGVEVGCLQQAADHEGHVGVERLLHLVERDGLLHHRTIEQESDDGGAFEADVMRSDDGRVDVAQEAVDAVAIAAVTIEGHHTTDQRFHLGRVLRLEAGREAREQSAVS